MKYFKTFEGFKKDVMKKIGLKDFKKIKKGTKLMYLASPVEVLDNNGYVLKLKGEDGRTFTVNKSQFDHGGMLGESFIDEGVMSQIDMIAKKARNAGDFTKKFFKEFGDKIKKSKESLGWVESLYDDIVFSHAGYPDDIDEAITPAITFEFPDERRARQFDLDIENSAIGIGDQVGNKVTVTEVDTKWRSTVKKFLIKNKGKVIEESVVTEAAQIPSNIVDFAKRRGRLRDVKQIARWAEKAGLGIRGGTAIGKGYDTLVLDLTYNGAEIYFDLDTGKIKVNRQPVNSWKTFSKAVNESSAKDGTEASDGKHKHTDHIEEDMEAMWKKAYGEKFATKYPGVAKIIRQRKIRDPREIARIWKETYGEDFKEEYPAMWDMLSK